MTGTLDAGDRDLYLGLATMADDNGMLLWRPPAIGANLYPYKATKRREAEVEQRGARLRAAGLLDIHDCGCASLPRFGDLRQVGGNKTYVVAEWHGGHGIRTGPDASGPVRTSTASGSGSGSDIGSVPGPAVATAAPDAAVPDLVTCPACGDGPLLDTDYNVRRDRVGQLAHINCPGRTVVPLDLARAG